MRDNSLKGLLMLGSLLGIIGLIFIFFSHDLGTSLTNTLVAGSDYAASTYESKVKTNTLIILVTGIILSVVGLSTVVFALYKMENIKY
ncbi:hypothetical protein [Halobacillus halophilus]|uniref:hypothetical protein n=1 Tax=Halobacillus halophilus TaxID=1570 RepID=UPI001CD5F0EA|nr:hypothetical protein [Halobacillus halophilus]MCA1010679.1 hypothetical protein [Halobacillus halophilus]